MQTPPVIGVKPRRDEESFGYEHHFRFLVIRLTTWLLERTAWR